MSSSNAFRCGRYVIDLDVPRVMGIVNVTPDSFSDGGLAFDAAAAVARAEALVDAGADLIDLGAESTRPGASPVSPDEEWSRLAPVLRDLRDLGVPLSVDTRNATMMERALDAGASMINDVSGFGDAAARAVVAASDCGVCVMHMRGRPETMQVAPTYVDVVAEVTAHLAERSAALVASGIAPERIVIDPGFGFGKTLEHNLALLRRQDALLAVGRPVLVGLSRKGMIGTLTGRALDQRMPGGIAAALLAVEAGARIVRTHDVAATVDALKVWTAVRTGRT